MIRSASISLVTLRFMSAMEPGGRKEGKGSRKMARQPALGLRSPALSRPVIGLSFWYDGLVWSNDDATLDL